MAEDNSRGGGDAFQIAKMLASVVWAFVLSVVYVIQDIYHLFVPLQEKSIAGQHVLVSKLNFILLIYFY